MREMVARPREIAEGLPDAVLPAGSAHSVSLGSDDGDGADVGVGMSLAPSASYAVSGAIGNGAVVEILKSRWLSLISYTKKY
jgi:hypothetical protein